MTARELLWKVGDKDVSCRIEESRGQGTFYVAGNAYPFRILDSTHIEISGRRHRFHVIHRGNSTTVWLNGRTYYLQRGKQFTETNSESQQSTGDVHALMPGKLLRLNVKEGDDIAEKQIVAIMESMKMESALFAPIAGRVVEVRFKPGDVVEMGDVVMVISSSI